MSERFRKMWQDPAMREKMLSRRAEVAAERKAAGNPINPSHAGVPWGMRRAQVKRFQKQARLEATLSMKKLTKAGVLTDDTAPEAREALHTALEVMRMPGDPKSKLAAARLVLDFTKAKPASKSEVTINTAEEWLAQVTEVNEQITYVGDAEASS
jgi:hypothetical protein